MGLFSFFRKNKQESASGQGEFLSRSAGESAAVRGRRSGSANARKSSKDEPNDASLPEKKRARRRLIGAIALVLAMVILLPMVLDSEPRPLADDIAIQIPSKDGKDAAVKPTEPLAAAKDEPAAAADKPVLGPDTPVLPVVPANAALPDAAPVQTPELSKPAAKTDLKAPALESKTPERSDERKKDAGKADDKPQPDDSARAMAILEGKASTAEKKPAATAAGGKFVIQVAALATQEKIDELRGKLSKAGIKSFTQKVATQDGERTRIRVGPFASKEEANKMRAKINKLGLNATLVAP